MAEEKPLFIEKKLSFWECPESPKPGTAFVFVGNGVPAVIVLEGKRGPTRGEIARGVYKIYYEVDMGERSLPFNAELPSCNASEFHAEVKLTYAVNDPVAIIQCARIDAGQFLQDLAIDVMRQASRAYSYDQIGEAENSLTKKIEADFHKKGFKLIHHAVKLSLNESVRNLIVERELDKYRFLVEKEKNEMKNEINRINQAARLDLKKERADLIAPLIKDGDWQRLLSMYDPNDPADEYLKQILAVMSDQRRNQDDIYNKVIEIALTKGVIESHELSELAKKLLIDKTGLDKAVAYISNKTGPISGEEESKEPMPDKIKD